MTSKNASFVLFRQKQGFFVLLATAAKERKSIKNKGFFAEI